MYLLKVEMQENNKIHQKWKKNKKFREREKKRFCVWENYA